MNLLPPFVWQRLRARFEAEKRRERVFRAAGVPAVTLESKHFRRLTMLATREEMLLHMPRNAVAAELGVAAGEFSRAILAVSVPRRLHLIDAWEDTRFHDGLASVQTKFASEIASGVVRVHRGLSTAVLPTFETGYFDWIYIDTDHSYETTRDELSIARTKVRPGGIIAGHDFTMGNWIDGIRYGVIDAVREFCVAHDWEMLYLTMESNGYHSFALAEIRD